MKNIAVILAAGIGKRLGNALPKQFLKLNKKAVILYSVEAFQAHPEIDEILIVTHADYLAQTKELIDLKNHSKVKEIIIGGKERYHSSIAAIEACKKIKDKENLNLIFHDAARPLINNTIITRVIECLDKFSAVDTAIPTTDTILIVDDNLNIKEIPNRSILFNSQTPQAFRYPIIKEAYEHALKDPNFTTADDCKTVKKYLPEINIHIVLGDTQNMKLTHPEDITILEKLVFSRQKAK
ncbi:MAG: IspD/TarI family cytidylyltransferase [Candidatus Riflebacteria bacterium]|nr:IspD/TarI family cytidylyltransferase [Candidatus Riflebacteria bacterium]